MSLLAPVQATIDQLLPHLADISAERRAQLAALTEYVVEQRRAQRTVSLNFICTHNSRRSHLAQVWAATAAAHFGVTGVVTYSGGTEVTAMNPRAVTALRSAGFSIISGTGDNPVHSIRFDDALEPLACYSKLYDAPENPTHDFAAVMTCHDADARCPVIVGARRIPLTYRDPKEADDTPEEAARYEERSRQIGTEMLAVMAAVVERLEKTD